MIFLRLAVEHALKLLGLYGIIHQNWAARVSRMIHIGCHLSVTNGYEEMGKTMLSFGGDTFAYFTRNPRGGKSKEIDPDDAAALNALLKKNSFGPLIAHGSYTMNLCAEKDSTRQNGLEMLDKDLQRMEMLPGNYYNFHPGSHVGQGTEVGIALIADALNRFLWKGMHTVVLLETMAGKGSEVGGTFEELREIIDRVELKEKIGVCFDTCHTWDAGYDLVHDFDGVLSWFDSVIGLDRLKAVHFNDSKNDRGSHKDRHEKLGKGQIGADALQRIVHHPVMQNLPFILETPNDEEGYMEEIRLVKSWMS